MGGQHALITSIDRTVPLSGENMEGLLTTREDVHGLINKSHGEMMMIISEERETRAAEMRGMRFAVMICMGMSVTLSAVAIIIACI
jgi:hypothetical protein